MTKKNDREYEIQILRGDKKEAESYFVTSAAHAEKAQEILLINKENFNIKEVRVIKLQKNTDKK